MENPIIKELQVLMAAATISDYCKAHNCNDCVFKAKSMFRPCPFMEEDSPLRLE